MKNNWHRIGLALLVLVIMGLGYGGWCNNSDDDETDTGSSITVSAPSVVTATITSGNIMVTWQDNSDNETNFCLYVKAYDASSWSLYSSVIPANATSYSFPSSDLASSSGNFQLCLTAYDSDDGAESDASNIVSISW
jgi:hypothetical protein